jgi:5-methyltetrahydrofolate--homocysteine methyltransferase
MFKSLADRLAEAFAEYLHHRVRTDLWGYARAGSAEPRTTLIAEQYTGHPPGTGLPGLSGPQRQAARCSNC